MTITIFRIECEHFDLRITICTYTITVTIDRLTSAEYLYDLGNPLNILMDFVTITNRIKIV